MTLILTQISQFGIAMAADSAVTETLSLNAGVERHRVLVGVRKLQPIHYLQAGISCWGQGEIQRMPTDIWLEEFITQHNNINTLHDFSISLQEELRRAVGRVRQDSLGFHLAGFVDSNGIKLPTFYHIHNGPSQYQRINPHIDPNLFNANNDMPPEVCPAGLFKITRNGAYQLYAELFHVVEEFFNSRVRPLGIEIPHPLNLSSLAE